jgi:hypothetical protein
MIIEKNGAFHMARRRVFKTSAECPGIAATCKTAAEGRCFIGKTVTFEESSSGPEINIVMDGAVVGKLDAAVQDTVGSAMNRGQSFTAVIEKASPIYKGQEPTSAYVDIKLVYMLAYGLPAIGEVIPPVKQPSIKELVQRLNQLPSEKPINLPSKSVVGIHHTSFLTTVAGVTFDGRQRVVARCSVGETLTLVRDPKNKYDKGAIKVMRSNGEQVGFVPASVSRSGDQSGLAFQMDHSGTEYRCPIKEITAFETNDGVKKGVLIEIIEAEKKDHEALVQRRIREIKNSTPVMNRQIHLTPLSWTLIIIVIGCILWAFK